MKRDQENNQVRKLPGFYIALCCCVLAIGIAGYVSDRLTSDKTNTQSESVFSDSAGGENAADSISAPNNYTAALPENAPTEAPAVSEEPAVPTVNSKVDIADEDYTADNPDVQSAAVIVSEDKPYFSMPAGGSILSAYTDSLSYNEATADYRTHNGIDIAADEGCSISASADGTVEDISADVMGQNITIFHSNGMESKYMGLSGTENLSIGDKVKSGDVIGTVGVPKGENISQPHLHFEMYKDGNSVDPEKYLK